MAYPPTVPPNTRTDATPLPTNMPFDINTISNALTDIINELGGAPKGTAASVTALLDLIDPADAITAVGGATAPTGWGLCDGEPVSRTTYAATFARIGTTYGAGDGSTTFNKPDLRSRFVAGKGTATWSDTLNETGGSKDAVAVAHTHTTTAHGHSVSITSSGAHPHTQTGYNNVANSGYLFRGGDGANGWETLNGSGTITKSYQTPDVASNGSAHTHTVAQSNASPGTNGQTPTSTGDDTNRPESVVVNWIIRAGV